jgi:hypothetical protein
MNYTGTGYTKISRSLVRNYKKIGLNDNELLFLIKIFSHKVGYPLTDIVLDISKDRASKIRKSLKEKGYLKYFSTKGVGTKYYVQFALLEDIGDFEVKTMPQNTPYFPQNTPV